MGASVSPPLLNYVQELFLCSIRLPIPSWDHPPRSRRENALHSDPAAARRDSSPLTRRKPRGCVGRLVTDGLIPTHAGKTNARTRSSLVHRSCGENAVRIASRWPVWGSSPLTQGKHQHHHRRARRRRLIPTHTGKTTRLSGRLCRPGAHPRSCRENSPMGSSWRYTSGSSPITRGNLRVVRAGQVVDGLIPAHAGKTST